MAKAPNRPILRSVNELVTAVARLVDTMASAAKADGARATRPARAGRSKASSQTAKAHWAGMTPRQRAARIRKMLAGRGLEPKPKSKKPPSPKSLALRAAIRAHWAAMTPAEHEARVRKMLAARGLQPK